MQSADVALLSIARNESRQGKQSEAEADARRALLEILRAQGKYSPATSEFIVGLASILVEQGRYPDAEKLARSALDVQHTLGVADDAPERVQTLSNWATSLSRSVTRRTPPSFMHSSTRPSRNGRQPQREAFELNGSRIAALYVTGQVDDGIKAAEALVNRQTEQQRREQLLYGTGARHAGRGLCPRRARYRRNPPSSIKALPILMTATRRFRRR